MFTKMIALNMMLGAASPALAATKRGAAPNGDVCDARGAYVGLDSALHSRFALRGRLGARPIIFTLQKP